MDVMLDIETFGKTSNAVIATLGVVSFDPMKVQTEEEIAQNHRFLIAFDIALQPGRSFDGDTVRWWMKQGDAARVEAISGLKDLRQGLAEYRIWYKAVNPVNAWCYGATFDHVILQNAFDEVGITNPTNYRNQMCARTLVKATGTLFPPSNSMAHSALDDAIRQVTWLQLALQSIRMGLNENSQQA